MSEIPGLVQKWAWKPSDSLTYFVEKDKATAFAEALRRSNESVAAAIKLQARQQSAENERAAKAKRAPEIIPFITPITYTVHTYHVSPMTEVTENER